MKTKVVAFLITAILVVAVVVPTVAVLPLQVQARNENPVIGTDRKVSIVPPNTELLRQAKEWRAGLDMNLNLLPDFEFETFERTKSVENYKLQNLIAFRLYLEQLGYNFDSESSVSRLESRIYRYYDQALSAGIITPIKNDPGTTIAPRWIAGRPHYPKMQYGNGGTHQVIAGRAYDYLSTIFPALFSPGIHNDDSTMRAAFVRYADWPDYEGSASRPRSPETLPVIGNIQSSNNSHFYNPINGFNYLSNTVAPGRNARERVTYYFNRAVNFYHSGNKRLAFNNLGKASHFLSDLAAVVHADYLTPSEARMAPQNLATVIMFGSGLIFSPINMLLILRHIDIISMVQNHMAFERVAQEFVDGGILTDSIMPVRLSTFAHAAGSVDHLAGAVATRSFMFYSDVGGRQNNVSEGVREWVAINMLTEAVDANAMMLHMFALAVVPTWQQPRWNGSTLEGHGSVSASGTYRSEHPWRAFNGTMSGGSGGNGDNWSVNAQAGHLELQLEYYIIVHSIELWGNTSAGNNRTRHAHFTAGFNVIPLGARFELANQNQAYKFIHVGGIRTNVIRLNITSSYGNWVGASMIRIHATKFY
ncbi:MAG: zinc dependent phospholipase C family protein [Firmicutes bacterium]|nr:zinc dependent phospholipase C family protein [Bacillota bacterium]